MIFKSWLPLALTITMISLLVYASVQHSIRSGADDPQIQLAEDAAALLAGGKDAASLVAPEQVDIAKSLAPYLIIFNERAEPIASSAKLHDATPKPPQGVFNFTKQNGEDRLTWQPEPGVRQAIVVRYFSGQQSGFVVAGRSLREIEKRESQLADLTAVIWSFTILTSLLPIALFHRSKKGAVA